MRRVTTSIEGSTAKHSIISFKAATWSFSSYFISPIHCAASTNDFESAERWRSLKWFARVPNTVRYIPASLFFGSGLEGANPFNYVPVPLLLIPELFKDEGSVGERPLEAIAAVFIAYEAFMRWWRLMVRRGRRKRRKIEYRWVSMAEAESKGLVYTLTLGSIHGRDIRYL